MRPRVLQVIGVVCLALILGSVAGITTDGFGAYWNWRDCIIVLFLTVLAMTAAAVGDVWMREDLVLWAKAEQTHRFFWGYFDVPEYLLRGGTDHSN